MPGSGGGFGLQGTCFQIRDGTRLPATLEVHAPPGLRAVFDRSRQVLDPGVTGPPAFERSLLVPADTVS
jgi:hypothetical protein